MSLATGESSARGCQPPAPTPAGGCTARPGLPRTPEGTASQRRVREALSTTHATLGSLAVSFLRFEFLLSPVSRPSSSGRDRAIGDEDPARLPWRADGRKKVVVESV